MAAPGSPEPPWGPGKEPPLPPGPPSVPVQTLPHFSATAETSVSSVCAPSHPKGLGLALLRGGGDSWRGRGRKKKKRTFAQFQKGIILQPEQHQALPLPELHQHLPAPLPLGTGARWGLALPPEAAGALSAVPHRGPGAAGAASPVVPHPRCRPCQCPVPHGKSAVSSGVVTGRGSVMSPVPRCPGQHGGGSAGTWQGPHVPTGQRLPPAPPGNLITAGRPLLPPASPQTRWQTGATVSSSLAAGLILG